MPLFHRVVSIKGLKQRIPQLFIRKFYQKVDVDLFDEYQLTKVLQDHTPSLVALSNDRNHVLKLIRPRKYHEIVKLLWGHSRLSKEIRGNFLLKDLGLNCPIIFEAGYALLPAKRYEFIGYYLMENLLDQGYDEVFNLFQQENLNAELRQQLFNKICDGLKTMYQNRIVFTDFTLGNVFGNNQGELIWIDTGVSQYKKHEAKKLLEKNNQAIERFLRIHDQLLTDAEKQQARSTLLIG